MLSRKSASGLKVVVALSCLAVASACSGSGPDGDGPAGPADIWDIDQDGIPKFVDVNYIELDEIHRISRFRSGEGHDYSDAFEHCRSMKHYFDPKPGVIWQDVEILSPVTGKVTRVEEEWAGTKLEIQSDSRLAFRFVIFHLNLSRPLETGDSVVAGGKLGNHVGAQTSSDIAVIVNDPTRQGRMISYFDTMTDALFQTYAERGVNSRAEMIISKAERDAAPLTCNGDVFVDPGPLPNWRVLDEPQGS
jgi:hypothetical protein